MDHIKRKYSYLYLHYVCKCNAWHINISIANKWNRIALANENWRTAIIKKMERKKQRGQWSAKDHENNKNGDDKEGKMMCCVEKFSICCRGWELKVPVSVPMHGVYRFFSIVHYVNKAHFLWFLPSFSHFLVLLPAKINYCPLIRNIALTNIQ